MVVAPGDELELHKKKDFRSHTEYVTDTIKRTHFWTLFPFYAPRKHQMVFYGSIK